MLFEEELVCAVAKESAYKKLSLARYLAADHVCISVLENQQAVPDLALTKVGAARRCAFTLPYFSVGLPMVAGTSLIATLPRKLAENLVHPEHTRLVAARQTSSRAFAISWSGIPVRIKTFAISG